MKTRPYIVCHMMASLDGRIDCAMTEQIESGNEYYEALDELNCPSQLMGRVTMQMHYADAEPFSAGDTTPVGREAFFVARPATACIVATDTHGSLRWNAAEYDGQHLVVIVAESCPKAYVEQLTQQGISWIATGAAAIDLPRAMQLLRCEFGVERLAVTGGGTINGAFLKAGLLDEVSMMYAPGIDGRAGMTAAFDGIAPADYPPTRLRLLSVDRKGDTVWMRYSTTAPTPAAE